MTDAGVNDSNSSEHEKKSDQSNNGISTLIKKISDFKEALVTLVAITGFIYAGFTYFAPASELTRLECAMRSQELLAIARDTSLSNERNKISAQDQDRLLSDLLNLIAADSEETDDMKRLKQRLRDRIWPKIQKIRDQIALLESQAAQLNANKEKLIRQVADKKCPE